MKGKRFILILSALILGLAMMGIPSDAWGAKKTAKNKAKTTAVKKSTSGKKKSGKNTTKTGKTTTTKKKRSSVKTKSNKTSASTSKKKSRKKKRNRRKAVAFKPYTPPSEPILSDSLTMLVNRELVAWVPDNLNPGGLRVNSVIPDSRTKTAKIGLNENFTYLPVTQQLITDMHRHLQTILPDSLANYYISLNVGSRNYSYYITKVDKLPEQFRKNIPFVVEMNPFVNPKKGMEGDIIAMWPSHGRYYKPGSGCWMWQRPQLFTCTEDTHTMAYILPFVVPMMENAGAYVLLPRERDTNSNEVIVDNDTNDSGMIFSQPFYKEKTGSKNWETGAEEGFIYDLPDFRDTENPFENGTYRQTTTITSGEPSIAAWYADIPEDGEYAVYVSYKSLPNSTRDAHYTVNYSGGTREFKVNQTMGGGTWIYLGTFPFEAGYSDQEPLVTLSNKSSVAGMTLTADAVKIGGGMGNIERSDRRSDIFLDPSTPEEGLIGESQNMDEEEDEEEDNESDEEIIVEDESEILDKESTQLPAKSTVSSSDGNSRFRTSGLPRFLEGARYWMHWAGVPEYIYSPYHGSDDYKDDYTGRGHWVNWLAGGSRVLPNRDGLKIPIDAVFALHSDAGKRADDTFVGTLGIYYTNGGDLYEDGTPRANSRTLTDMLMRQITGDIRQTWEPNWTRRSMWDKSYVEARVPEVPTTLIELLSHQNFADMRYSLDPAFRFTVSRAIYKAIGRFVAERKDRKFVVQPLPVKDFAIERIKKETYRLSWVPTPDRLEPTAVADKYLIFERTADELGFHLLGETTTTHFDVIVEDNDIHSFKVVAANEGGRSFPSEILALRESPESGSPVLIINGFTRVSAPGDFSNSDGSAGFNAIEDFGVPYKKDILFTGYQNEFRRNAGESFGRCDSDYASTVIAGNTFDFPYIHGLSIAASGRGFVSASVGAVVAGDIKLSDYSTIDLILGKQKLTVTGNGNTGVRFTAMPKKLQTELADFIHHGGDLFVTGAYIASDLIDYRSPDGSTDFMEKTLGITKRTGQKSYSGQITGNNGPGVLQSPTSIQYSNTLNSQQYIVENPDIISPSKNGKSEIFMTFTDTGLPCGIITEKGDSKIAVMSIPFETVSEESVRNSLMKRVLDYIEK